MCKAQNNFQLVLVKLFSLTYYCSDQVLARYMSTASYLSKSLPLPPPHIFLAFSLLRYYCAVYYLFHFTYVLVK